MRRRRGRLPTAVLVARTRGVELAARSRPARIFLQTVSGLLDVFHFVRMRQTGVRSELAADGFARYALPVGNGRAGWTPQTLHKRGAPELSNRVAG